MMTTLSLPKTLMLSAATMALATAPGLAAVGEEEQQAAQQQMQDQQAQGQEVQISEEVKNATADWPEESKQAMREMYQKYGEPNGVTSSMLIWEDNGPWKRSIVYKEVTEVNYPIPRKNVLEQAINYDVPPDMFDELAQFDGSVYAKYAEGELASRCENEAGNILALNLANDIIEGKLNVEEARQQFGENIKQFMTTGQMPEYMQAFQFEIPEEDITNPGEQIVQIEGAQQAQQQK